MRVVAATVDSPEDLRRMRHASGASFEFLSDPEGRLLDLLRIRHEGASPTGGDVARSSSFLISPEGEILWAHLTPTYRLRPKPARILATIDALDRGR
ncbi:MAG: redoxin domain-containing protein [Holophagales bacterium]|nr:redoxin domain-containing protein [Holophagales bacterium]